jgi:hypothetical protein
VVIACRLLLLSPCHGALARESRRRFEVARVRPPSSINSHDIRHLATVTRSHAVPPYFNCTFLLSLLSMLCEDWPRGVPRFGAAPQVGTPSPARRPGAVCRNAATTNITATTNHHDIGCSSRVTTQVDISCSAGLPEESWTI